MKQIGAIGGHDGCEQVNVCSGAGLSGLFRTRL